MYSRWEREQQKSMNKSLLIVDPYIYERKKKNTQKMRHFTES